MSKIPNVYVAKSPLHGKGLFAKKKLRKGTVLGVLEGKPTKKEGTYVLWLTAKKGLRITNDFRFINHGRPANCALYDDEVVVLKTVKPDEELLHDYGW